jgi:hypothetical protein
MAESMPSVASRFSLALATFWRILVDPQLAGEAARLRASGPTAPPDDRRQERNQLRDAEPNAALQLLGLLQQEGRLIDFLEEGVAAYSDAEVGAATRVVHEGCRRALRQHFAIEAVRAEPEGARVTLAEGFDPAALRLTGNVVGRPPFTGSLTHRGWRVTEVRLPKVATSHDLSILAPAEIEL